MEPYKTIGHESIEKHPCFRIKCHKKNEGGEGREIIINMKFPLPSPPPDLRDSL